jgi:hypothetical protein
MSATASPSRPMTPLGLSTGAGEYSSSSAVPSPARATQARDSAAAADELVTPRGACTHTHALSLSLSLSVSVCVCVCVGVCVCLVFPSSATYETIWISREDGRFKPCNLNYRTDVCVDVVCVCVCPV